MIAIENYIQDLLFEKECVILPQFGALLSSYKSAYYNSIKSTYYPPSKNIAFNAALTNNDWLLADTISSSENISKEEALTVIENYVKQIQAEIHSNQSHKIDGIGTFMLNKEGAITFLPSINSNFFEESFGLEPIQVSKIQTDEKSEQIIKHTKLNKDNTIMAENKKVEENEKQSSFFIIAPILLLLIAGGAFTWFMVDKPSFKNAASFGFVEGTQTELIAEHNEEDPHDVDSHTNSEEDNHDWADNTHDEHNEESSHEGDADWHSENDNDTHEEVEHEEKSHTEDTHVEVSEDGSYHVVAGAFGVEENATSFAENIQGAKIIRGNRYHMVVVGSYDSESDAMNALPSLQSTHGSGLWIFNK